MQMKVKWKGKTEFLMLTYDKIYDVISIEKGWYRVKDDSGDEYLYPPEKFEIEKQNERKNKRKGARLREEEIESIQDSIYYQINEY